MTKKPYKWANILAACGILFGVAMIVVVGIVDRQLGFADLLGKFSHTVTGFLGKPTIFSTDSLPSAITPLPIDSVTPSESPSPSTTTNMQSDSNPVTTCTSTFPSCVDKTIQLPQSECSATYCCQVQAGGPWALYPNQASCTQAQNAANAQNTSTPQSTSQNTTTQTTSGTTSTTNTNFSLPTPVPYVPQTQQIQPTAPQGLSQEQQQACESQYGSELQAYQNALQRCTSTGGTQASCQQSAQAQYQPAIDQLKAQCGN